MADGREPLCLALVLCDGVYTDPWTGRKTLLGVLTEFASSVYPCTMHGFAVYMVLTECRGLVRLSLRVVDANDDERLIAQTDIEIDNPDPLIDFPYEHTFSDVQFPHPGQYRVQLLADGAPLMERRLTALYTPPENDHAE